MRGRLIWQLVCFFFEGVFVMVFSKAQTLGGAITALMTFSLFVQGAEGSTFGIVPYLNPNITGIVTGMVGAGGNAGAVIFSFFFPTDGLPRRVHVDGRDHVCYTPAVEFCLGQGLRGLFFLRRLKPEPSPLTPRSNEKAEKPSSNRDDTKFQQPPNTSCSEQPQQQLQATTTDEGAHNQPRSYIDTDPHSSISGPLSH